MGSRSTTELPPPRARGSASERSRRASVLPLALVAILVSGGSVAVALGATGARPTSTTSPLELHHVLAPPSRWSVPRNESAAPVVGTPGGATPGAGNFNAVSCDVGGHCVAVGADTNGNALGAYSNDGGATWTLGAVLPGTPSWSALSCPTALRCVAVGQGVAATSKNGGVTWANATIPAVDTTLLSVSCATTTTCAAVGVSPVTAGPFGGALLVSSDGGASWRIPSAPTNVGALGSVTCASATFCVAVGATILVSSDGGATWTQRFVNGGTGVLRSVSCDSPTACVAVGPSPLSSSTTDNALEVVTSDGGATWSSVPMPSGSASVDTISCVAGGACSVAGPSLNSSPPPFFTSLDGGATWNAQSPPAPLTAITALSCVSGSTCFFVGSSGNSPTSGSTATTGAWQISPVSIAFTPVAAAPR